MNPFPTISAKKTFWKQTTLITLFNSKSGFVDSSLKATQRALPSFLFAVQRVEVHARSSRRHSRLSIEEDCRFRELQGTMDAVYSDLCKRAEVKYTPVITKEEEDRLWEAKELGTDTPKQLLQAVFFHVGKVLCLCGGVEQRGYLSFKGNMVQIIMCKLKMARKTTAARILKLNTKLFQSV